MQPRPDVVVDEELARTGAVVRPGMVLVTLVEPIGRGRRSIEHRPSVMSWNRKSTSSVISCGLWIGGTVMKPSLSTPPAMSRNWTGSPPPSDTCAPLCSILPPGSKFWSMARTDSPRASRARIAAGRPEQPAWMDAPRRLRSPTSCGRLPWRRWVRLPLRPQARQRQYHP